MTSPVTADSPYLCGWSVDVSCWPKLEDADEEVQIRCVTTASEIVWALSGRQFGLCETKVRPCREVCCDPCQSAGWFPQRNSAGAWVNVTCRKHCRGSCDCQTVCELWLPGPVDSITEVHLDGRLLDPSEYKFDQRNGTLVRVGELVDEELEPACWPKCQNMLGDPAADENTFEITYLKGRPIPTSIQGAAAELADEIALACARDDSCSIPRSSLRQIQRQGKTEVFVDPNAMIDNNRTGIFAVDLALKAFNPKGRARSAAILSPDVPEYRSFS